MTRYDEPEIRRQSESPPQPAGDGGSRPIGAIVLVVVALAAAAVLAWFLLRDETEAPTPEPAESPALPTESEPSPTEPTAEVDEPELSGDALVRRLVAALSSRPEVVEWLANDDLVGRFVRVVGNVAYDENPAVHVPFLRPEERFSVVQGNGDTVIAAQGYRRYDLLADVFVSLDEEGAAEVLERLEPELERAWEELGYPGTFRRALERAIERLLAVPIVEDPIALEEGVVSWRFESARLEALAPAQKQLLRMGPRNVDRIQAKLRSLRRELGAG